MTTEVLFAGLPIADLQAAVGRYEQLIGRTADVPNRNEVMWCLAGNGWLSVIEEAEPAEVAS